MEYIHHQFILNNRSVSIQDALNGNVKPLTDFEASTLLFIKKWLSGATEFSLQTSGSTGTPKLINVTSNQLQESAKATLQALNLTENSSSLICLNTQYIAGIMMLVRCMVGNLKMEIVEPVANPFEKLPSSTQFDFVPSCLIKQMLSYSNKVLMA